MTAAVATFFIEWTSDWMSSTRDSDYESKLCVGSSDSGFHSGLQVRREGGTPEIFWSTTAKATLQEAKDDAYEQLDKSSATTTEHVSALPLFHNLKEFAMSQVTNPIRTVAILSGENTDQGKSSLSRHMLRPGMIALHGSCEYMLVEKIGRDIPEGEDHRYRPEELKQLMLRLAMIRARKSGSAVVDVGGGQNAAFMAAVREAKGSEARFDLVLSVVTGKVKMDKVLEIHEELILTSIEPSKIVVVINRVAIGKTYDDVRADPYFATLFAHAGKYGYRIITVVLPENEAIELIRKNVALTIGALAAGGDAFNAEFERLVQSGMEAEAAEVFELDYLSGVARSLTGRMEECFAKIFGITCAAGMEVVEIYG